MNHAKKRDINYECQIRKNVCSNECSVSSFITDHFSETGINVIRRRNAIS